MLRTGAARPLPPLAQLAASLHSRESGVTYRSVRFYESNGRGSDGAPSSEAASLLRLQSCVRFMLSEHPASTSVRVVFAIAHFECFNTCLFLFWLDHASWSNAVKFGTFGGFWLEGHGLSVGSEVPVLTGAEGSPKPSDAD